MSKLYIPEALLAILFTSALLGSALTPAFASAPMVKTTAPTFYRFMLGDIEVTALSDGTADFPVDALLTGTTPVAVRKTLAQAYSSHP
jgi:hypothetical protein